MPNAPSRFLSALAGVLAGIAGLATSQGVTWAFDGGSSPLVAVASDVRDATPGRLAHHLIELVGHWDKRLLVIGTTLVLLAVCAVAGLLSRRHALLSDLVFLVLAGLGVAALLRSDHWTPVAMFSVLVGLVTWIVVLRLLNAPFLATVEPSAQRRALLVRSALVALGAVVVAGGGYLSGGGRRKVETARRLLRLPVTRGTVPAGAHPDVPGLSAFRTPNAHFYQIDTLISPPSIAPHDWSLRIHGMVDRELTIGYQDLLDRRLTEDWITICCVSNPIGGPLIGNAWWSGVPARDLLRQAGPHPGADAVLQTSQDGWTCATPLSALTDEGRNALLAVAMNGQPLPVRHGFPVRMVVPGLYGYVSATKWVVDLEVTRFDKVSAYWTDRGWSEKGPVKTQSRIDVPRDGGSVPAGSVPVAGVAWAQHTGVRAVEFQLDGGPWQPAGLGRVPSVDTWAQWSGSVQVAAGRHTLRVRATDRSGYTQTGAVTDVIPNGATGWHTIEFTAH